MIDVTSPISKLILTGVNIYLESRDSVVVPPLGGDDRHELPRLVDDGRAGHVHVGGLEGRREPPLSEHAVRRADQDTLRAVDEHLERWKITFSYC